MKTENLYKKSLSYLKKFCEEIPERSVGSEGNRRATDFFAKELSSLGWQPEMSELDVIDWEDGAGYKEGKTAFSFFDVPEAVRSKADEMLAKFDGITEGILWYQGDHGIFIQQGCPAIAVSSQWFIENAASQDITHSPKDNIGIVDCRKLIEIAEALNWLLRKSAA